MLDSDTALTQDDIAEIAKLPRSYVSRVMRATLLAPDIIEAILDGRQPKHMTLTDLTRMPNDWNEQREYFGCI
jgi:hypothetical protein